MTPIRSQHRGLLQVLLLALLPAVCLPGLGGCASKLDWSAFEASDPEATELLDRAVAAHGGSAFASLTDISVSYDGTWHGGVAGIQPELVDPPYRGRSEERLLLRGDALLVGQRHGEAEPFKDVRWDGADIRTWYDGVPSDDEPKLDASAAVAEAYTMFLTAPHYIARRAEIVVLEAPAVVDGRPCEQMLAILRPGLGRTEEDRVLVAIDSETSVVRRLRFSLSGVERARGALIDVTLTDHRTVGGVVWPTRFKETVQRPIRLTVHRWWITGLDLDRGLTESDLAGGTFTGAATAPAAALDADD